VSGSYRFVLKPNIAVTLRQEAVQQALQTIERRVNEFGVTEPIVTPYGSAGDQIIVQLPGVTDVARAKELIRSEAFLELKLVEDGPAISREALLQSRNNMVPQDMEVVTGADETSTMGQGAGTTVFYLVRKVATVTGRDLRNARPSLDENNLPAISFSLNRDGAAKFGRATGENIGKQLAIILDGRVQSAPRIEGRINDEGRITGSFTQEEASDLALKLRSGALPAPLTYLEEPASTRSCRWR
jgi:preprotein translocase subunit SecD